MIRSLVPLSLLAVVPPLGGLRLSAQDALATLPQARGATWAVQFASTDPRGGNSDYGHFLDQADSDGFRLLASWDGAGRIDRFWSANPRGELRVEVDGEELWSGPMVAWFWGRAAVASGPLADGRGTGGGALSYQPVAFSHSLRVLARGKDLEALAYQVGLTVQSNPDAPAGPGVAARPARDLLGRGIARETTTAGARANVRATRAGTEVVTLGGAGEIVELSCTPAGPGAEWSPALRRGCWLECYANGSDIPQCAAPLGDLFGVGFDGQGIETLALGSAGRARVLRLPMPYRDGLRLVLRSVDSRPTPAVQFTWQVRALPAAHERGTLHARFARATNVTGEPFELLRLAGAAGHVVGCVYNLAGATAQGLSFLEGDEQLIVDGGSAPTLQGTATEHDIGGASSFRGGPFGAPFHSVACLDETASFVTAARFRILDPVPFDRSLVWTTEHGGQNDAPGSDYATTVFWYQHSGPTASPMSWTERRAATAPQRSACAMHWTPAELGLGSGMLDKGVHRIELPDSPATARLRRDRHQVIVERAGDDGPLRTLLPPGADPLEITLSAETTITGIRATPWLPSVRAFRVVGPFRPSDAGRGIDEPFGPEREGAAAKAAYPEHAGVQFWREAPQPGWTGYLDLKPLSEPSDGVVVYACTEVHVPEEQDATLVVGGGGNDVRVLLDGEPVHRVQRARGATSARDRVAMHLTAGDHLLLFKVENDRGAFGLYAHFEDAAGLTFSTGLSETK